MVLPLLFAMGLPALAGSTALAGTALGGILGGLSAPALAGIGAGLGSFIQTGDLGEGIKTGLTSFLGGKILGGLTNSASPAALTAGQGATGAAAAEAAKPGFLSSITGPSPSIAEAMQTATAPKFLNTFLPNAGTGITSLATAATLPGVMPAAFIGNTMADATMAQRSMATAKSQAEADKESRKPPMPRPMRVTQNQMPFAGGGEGLYFQYARPPAPAGYAPQYPYYYADGGLLGLRRMQEGGKTRTQLSGGFDYKSGSRDGTRRKNASGSLTLSGDIGSITPGFSYSKDSSRQQSPDGVVVDKFGRRIGLSINGELFLDEGGQNKLRAGMSRDTMSGGYRETAGEELLDEDAYNQALERYFLGLDVGPASFDVQKAGDEVSGRAAYRPGENMEFSVEDSNRGDPTFGFQFAKRFAEGGLAELDQRGGQIEVEDEMEASGMNEKDVIVEAISAIKGAASQPEVALGMFVQKYGEDALRDLVDRVQSGEFDDTVERFESGENGEVRGPGDGSGVDDMVPATLEGEQDVLLSDGEFVLRKKTADALERAYGGGFLDVVNRAEEEAPRKLERMVG